MVCKPLGYLHFLGKQFGKTFPREIIGCPLESLPIKYLGFPLVGNPMEEIFLVSDLGKDAEVLDEGKMEFRWT